MKSEGMERISPLDFNGQRVRLEFIILPLKRVVAQSCCSLPTYSKLRQDEEHIHSPGSPAHHRCETPRPRWRKGHHCRNPAPQAATAGCHTFPSTRAKSFNDRPIPQQLDHSISHRGIRVLKSPPRTPKANSLCERVIGTLRRECLDYFIPITGSHLRCVTQNWASHYNKGRPHSSIGPGIPAPPPDLPVAPQIHRHRIPMHLKVVARPILGGLHHDYGLLPNAA